MTKGLVIRSRELGGKIVTLGDGVGRGIVVEQPDFSSNDWGCESGAMVLKRNPRVQWPDLRANAPILVEDRGVPVWRGRIKQTPQTDGGLARSISVVCEGQQFHLDDDAYERKYVDTDLGHWTDGRGSSSPLLAVGAGALCAAGQVTAEGGNIMLGFPIGYGIVNGDNACAIYDAGEGNTIGGMSFTVTSSNNNGPPAAVQSLLRILWSNDNFATSTIIYSAFLTTIGVGPLTVDLGSLVPARYFAIYQQMIGAGAIPADSWVKFSAINMFGSFSFDSAGASILKAGAVVQDAITRATIKLSTDLSLLTPTVFNIPSLDMSGPSTPREMITGVNAFHDYQFRVGADNRAEYRPRPATPTIEVGADSLFNEASAGDASEIYTSVIVVYTDAAGAEQRVIRTQAAALQTLSALQLTNPSAAVNTTGWVATTGTLTRDTGVFDTTPASFKIACATVGTYGYARMVGNTWNAGTWVPGRAYSLAFAGRMDTPTFGARGIEFLVIDANGQAVGSGGEPFPVANTWKAYSAPFVLQTAAAPTVQAVGWSSSIAGSLWIDSMQLFESSPTIVDQWGFKRTKILDTGMSLTAAGALQIADTFLLGHRSTPLKGSLVVTGDSRARRSPSGTPLRCSDLLGCVGELVRFRHLIDPETGKVGRIGRIASASWDAAANVATLEIDSTTKNFEAMLARLALVTGQVRS